MPNLGTAPLPNPTTLGYQAGPDNISSTFFATNSRSRGFLSFLRETLRVATWGAGWVVGGGLNPAYTMDPCLAVKHKPVTSAPPASPGNIWQAWTGVNAVHQLQTLQTETGVANSAVTYQNLTRVFRVQELFANVRPEGPSLDETGCGPQTSNVTCAWNFDRSKAIYDKLSDRFLVVVRSVNMLYPSDPVGDLGRLYLAVSETSDVAGKYRLFRITPAASPVSPQNPGICGGLYPQLDSPVGNTMSK